MLIDKNKNIIVTDTLVIESNTFYLWSTSNFNIEIVSVEKSKLKHGSNLECSIYSCTDANTQPVNSSKFVNLENYGYTVFVPSSDWRITIRCYNSDWSQTLTLHTVFEDSIANPYESDKYARLLTNFNLPNYTILKDILLDSNSKTDIIKRLLLDFRDILQTRGTIQSIKSFLKFMGFTDERIRVIPETQPVDPSTTVDGIRIKTGDYYVLLDMFTDGSNDGVITLNRKNMPAAKLRDFNIEQTLVNAIAIANTYFTGIEQDIVFIGLNTTVNVPSFKHITTQPLRIHEQHIVPDNFEFTFSWLNPLNLLQVENSENEYVRDYQNTVISRVKKSRYTQGVRKLYRSNFMYLSKDAHLSTEIPNSPVFEIKQLINKNDNEITRDTTSTYGCCISFDLLEHIIDWRKYSDIQLLRVTIQSEEDPLIRHEVENKKQFLFVITELGRYRLRVDIQGLHNSVETYYTWIEIEDNINLFKFDIYSSQRMKGENERNELGLAIDSSTTTILNQHQSPGMNFIEQLKTEFIPEKLDQYFNIYQQDVSKVSKWLLPQRNVVENNTFYTLPDINPLVQLSEVTNTLSLSKSSNWIKMYVINTNINRDNRYQFFFKYFDDVDTFDYRYIPLRSEGAPHDVVSNALDDKNFKESSILFNHGYLNVIEIESDDVVTDPSNHVGIKYFMFITNILGADEFIFDNLFVTVNNDEKMINIRELVNVYPYVMPVNHSFTFDHETAKELPTKRLNHISEDVFFPSVFEYLSENEYHKPLKIGDVIFIQPNNNYISNYHSLRWELYDAFTNKIVYRSTDYALKYRISYNSIFNLVMYLTIGNKEYKIERKSIFNCYKF